MMKKEPPKHTPHPRYVIVEDRRRGLVLTTRPPEPQQPKPPLGPRIRLFLVKYFTPTGWAVRYYQRQDKKRQRREEEARNTMIEQIRTRWKEPW